MIRFICRHWDYHLRLERVEENFKRADTEYMQRAESTIVKRCQDCGTQITVKTVHETVITPSHVSAVATIDRKTEGGVLA